MQASPQHLDDEVCLLKGASVAAFCMDESPCLSRAFFFCFRFCVQVDDVLEFVFSHCLSASAPPATETGGKKKTNTAWRSVVTAATKFLVRVVVGTHVRIVDETVESDIAAERKQRSADIAAKLFSVAQSTANTVASKAAEQCTDNREHVLICCCRFVRSPWRWKCFACVAQWLDPMRSFVLGVRNACLPADPC